MWGKSLLGEKYEYLPLTFLRLFTLSQLPRYFPQILTKLHKLLSSTDSLSLSHSLPLSVDMEAHVTVTAAQNSFMAASSGQWSYDS